MFEEDDKKTELLQKPREYQVKFTFPNPTPLNPPILGISSKIIIPGKAVDEGIVRKVYIKGCWEGGGR